MSIGVCLAVLLGLPLRVRGDEGTTLVRRADAERAYELRAAEVLYGKGVQGYGEYLRQRGSKVGEEFYDATRKKIDPEFNPKLTKEGNGELFELNFGEYQSDRLVRMGYHDKRGFDHNICSVVELDLRQIKEILGDETKTMHVRLNQIKASRHTEAYGPWSDHCWYLLIPSAGGGFIPIKVMVKFWIKDEEDRSKNEMYYLAIAVGHLIERRK